MFTTYIDDSGSEPNHRVVVASGIVIPAMQIVPFEAEWNKFLAKEGIDEFHSSVCLARNPKSEFANWDDARVQRVFARIRQITTKYASKAFCILIHKDLYDEIMPQDMRERVGSYYVWALSSLLGLTDDFARKRGVPMEYVFDTADKQTKREVDEGVKFSEDRLPGHYVFDGHYSFRNRKDVPALQAADFFAWICFQQGRRARLGHSIHPFAQESWDAFAKFMQGEWVVIQSLNREGLENWVKDTYQNPVDVALQAFKTAAKDARMPKKRTITKVIPPSGTLLP